MDNVNNKNENLRYLRNLKIANILLTDSYFFQHLLEDGFDVKPSGLQSVEIDYSGIMTMSEFIQSDFRLRNIKDSEIFDRTYKVPVTITYAGGDKQKIDAIFDDHANNIATLVYSNDSKDPNLNNFTISKHYYDQCTKLADSLLKKGYSPSTIRAIMKLAMSKSFMEMMETMGEQNRVIPMDENSLELLAQKYEELLVKEGLTPEELNKVRLEDLLVGEAEKQEYDQKTESDKNDLDKKEEGDEKEEEKELPTTPEPSEEEQKDETQKEEKEEEERLGAKVGIDKISRVLAVANVRASQVQDIIFIPHPRELNQYLPGQPEINNDQEVTLIKLRGGLRQPSRFEIVQGEGENIHRIETRGLYNDTLNEIFPEKSTIGTNAYSIKEKNDKEVKVDLTCDGQAQRINLSDVPLSQRISLEKQAEMAATLEEIQRRTDLEKQSARSITDPVEREKALARVHENAVQDLNNAQVPGNDEEAVIAENMKEIVEHLKAAEEAERIKAEEEQKRKEEEEKAAQENEENPEGPSLASTAMLGVGMAAVGLTALSDKDINNLLADVGEPPKTIASGHDHDERLRTDPFGNPY